ncbi:MAG: hypothetical protein EP343_12075 [Deltaproteobacteria bacterium]|nr:MAG: hypothetical protein EP343_12075 [Deltaproteobacteria bacterium]
MMGCSSFRQHLFLAFSLLSFCLLGLLLYDCNDFFEPNSDRTETTIGSVKEAIPKERTSVAEASPEIEAGNKKPVANAGQNQIVNEGQIVYLDGTSSQDPERENLLFQWRLLDKPSESQAELNNEAISTPSFLADKFGNYIIELVVSDGWSKSFPDNVKVEVLPSPRRKPVLTELIPEQAAFGRKIKVQLKGLLFNETTQVLFDGQLIDSSNINFKSSTHLEAIFDLQGISAGEYPIKVRNKLYVSMPITT